MSYSAMGRRGAEVNKEDNSVMDGELVGGGKHGLPDPVENLSQLAEDGQ